IAVLSYFPIGFAQFLTGFSPVPYLHDRIAESGNAKTLIFLNSKWENDVNWNDPFLRDPVILCRDLGSKNLEAMNAFPQYRPVYFRTFLNFEKTLKGGYQLMEDPDPGPPGRVDLFQLGLAIEAGKDDPEKDCFDETYKNLIHPDS